MKTRELFDLTNRTAIVSGACGLYGKAISEALCEAGAHVIVASRNIDKCEEWATELRHNGYKASAKQYDQEDKSSIVDFAKRVIDEHKNIHVLVNNAVSRKMKSYSDPLECWEQSMMVNSTGLFKISQLFLDHMIQKKQGNIINIASIQGVVAPDFMNYNGLGMTTPPDYHFNKHGMIGLTKYLAAFAGPHGVRVNAISPGGYDPEGSGTNKQFLANYCKRVFLGRMAEYDDIKGCVVFLASEAARYITGQNLIVDGGYTC